MTARERSFFASLWRLLRTPVPPGGHRYLRVGWVILLLFAVQVVTGILLSLYYEPSDRTAAISVQLIVRDVESGWLVRGLHYWSTTAILALGLFFIARMLVVGAYRREGMARWYVALLLFALGLSLAFSGQLLPWDEEAYWLLRKALASIETIPLVGSRIATMFRGGEEITAYTLRRAHTIHVLVLPVLSAVLLAVYLWLVARSRGGSR